jgi:hypothetical protein
MQKNIRHIIQRIFKTDNTEIRNIQLWKSKMHFPSNVINIWDILFFFNLQVAFAYFTVQLSTVKNTCALLINKHLFICSFAGLQFEMCNGLCLTIRNSYTIHFLVSGMTTGHEMASSHLFSAQEYHLYRLNTWLYIFLLFWKH